MAKPETTSAPPGEGFERSDVSARTFLVLTGLLLAVMFGTVATVSGIHLLSAPVPRPPTFGTAKTSGIARPPRLQVSPRAELDRYRAAQRTRLRGYGWVDRKRGVVHIPIEEAIGLLVEQGWPAGTRIPEKSP